MIELFTARANVDTDITADIGLDVIGPNGTSIVTPGPLEDQPFTFTPDSNGDWEIIASAQSFSKSRVVTFTGGNNMPIANAGSDQTVVESLPVVIDGSASFDPDAGDTLTYAWTRTGGSGNPSLTGANTDTLSFTNPSVGGPDPLTTQFLEFTLIVKDQKGVASIADVVIITRTQNFS